MKSATLPVLVSAILMGAGGGAVAGYLAGGGVSAEENVTPAGSRDALPATQILEELRQLRDEERALSDRLARLENRPAPVRTTPFDENRQSLVQQLAALAKRVEELGDGALGGQDPAGLLDVGSFDASPEFTAKVQKTLQRIRKHEQADKWRSGTRKRLARLDDYVTRMRKELNLSDTQAGDLRKAYTAQNERNLELIRLWEEGHTPDEQLGAVKRANRDQHQQTLARILTPTQLQQLRTSQAARNGK